jgi:hypothetical protein
VNTVAVSSNACLQSVVITIGSPAASCAG